MSGQLGCFFHVCMCVVTETEREKVCVCVCVCVGVCVCVCVCVYWCVSLRLSCSGVRRQQCLRPMSLSGPVSRTDGRRETQITHTGTNEWTHTHTHTHTHTVTQDT